MATKYIVNNVTGQTINGESILPKYKVYIALLTQSGGTSPDSFTGGSLSIGRTYVITNYQLGDDFTNVGAPSNSTGIKFVATGTTPSVWTNSSELSWNNGAPEVIVLENTIGNIYFEYFGIGNYFCRTEPESLFTVGKTVGFIGSVGDDSVVPAYGFLRNPGADSFVILTQDFSRSDSDSMLLNTSIEIRVYN